MSAEIIPAQPEGCEPPFYPILQFPFVLASIGRTTPFCADPAEIQNESEMTK